MTFLRFRTVCTVLFCAGLLALFWIPQRMLMQSADEWNRAAEEAADLMRAAEYERGERVCKALYESFRADWKRVLPTSNFSFSFSALVKALVTRIPLMLDSRDALISAMAERVSRNALRIFRRRE